jgi:signal transduction histidine kinase
METGVSLNCPEDVSTRMTETASRARGRLSGRDRLSAALKAQSEVLDLIAKGAGLKHSMSHLALVLEDLFEAAFCAVSQVNEDRSRLHLIAAPSLPEAYRQAVDSVAICLHAGPCAAAAYRREPLFRCDFTAEPHWAAFQDIAASHDLRSCWSQPILDRDGESLGTITLFCPEADPPDGEDCQIIDSLCPLARVAIESDRHAQALNLADERFQSLASTVPGVVYQRVVKPDGDVRYNYISDGALELFGVPAAEIVADPQALFDCHGPEYRRDFRERIMTASRELTMWDVEAPIITRNGEHKWTHAIARPQPQPDGSVIWNGIILDATRIKQANIELAAANRAKSDFLANMSHELRTPLNAIIGFSEIFLGETFGDLGSPKYKSYAKDIHASGKHLLDVINDILDLTKIESNTTKLSEDTVDLRETIEKSVRLVKDRTKAQKISLQVKISKKLPNIVADEKRIKQILLNLLSNAEKFTPDGGTIAITAGPEPDGSLAISISDNGIGIAAKDLDSMFDPFVQADSGLNRKFDGTGLGLPLTKAMVEMHGGTIELKSEVDRGTEVVVRFPSHRVVA